MTAITRRPGGMSPPSKREYKGKSLLKSVDNYVVVDLETTGLSPIGDEIIEFAAVKVENGIVVSEFQSLVKPSIPVSKYITKLTGITNEMLETAPSISDVLPRFLAFIGKDIIVAHNAHFDINFLYEACVSYDTGVVLDNDFIDTMWLSRILFPELIRHRLKTLVKRFGIAIEVEHRGLSDALNTHKCYEHIKQYAAVNNPKFIASYRSNNMLKAKEKVSNKKYINKSTPVYGKTFVFTGELERMLRRDAERLVEDMGGICGERVTYKTNFLVLGDNDFSPAVKDAKSSKHEKAEKYKALGLDIEIITEDVFYEMVDEGYEEAG